MACNMHAAEAGSTWIYLQHCVLLATTTQHCADAACSGRVSPALMSLLKDYGPVHSRPIAPLMSHRRDQAALHHKLLCKEKRHTCIVHTTFSRAWQRTAAIILRPYKPYGRRHTAQKKRYAPSLTGYCQPCAQQNSDLFPVA